jgi:U3 small nucleolar RNA-associated protein 4
MNGHVEPGGEDEGSIEDEGPESENDSDDDISIGLVSRAAVSADGQWLATTDHLCRTHVFNLDSLQVCDFFTHISPCLYISSQHHCALPSLPHPAQTVSFDPSSPHLLVIAMPNNSLQIYDVESRQQPDWGRALTASLPKRFTHLHDTVLGVTFDPSVMSASSDHLNSDGDSPRGLRPREALFWGSTWLCKVQLDAPPGWGGFNKKRRRGASKPTINGTQPVGGPGSENFKLITHYRPILHAEFIGTGELLIVERPAVDVLAQLPPAFWRPKYGAS